MARTVGNVEVTVDANTAKLKAQLAKAGAEGGQAAAKEIDEALDDIEAEVGINLSQADMRRVRASLARIGDNAAAILGIELEDGDVARVESTLNELGDDAVASVGVELEDGDVARSEAVLARMGDGATAQVGVDIDNASKAKADAFLRANFSDVGEESGNLFSQGFSRGFGGGGGGGGGGLSTRMKAIAAGIVVLMEPAAVALEGLASGAIQVLSSAFSALGAAAGASLPIFAGLGGTFAAIAVGAQGVGDAMGAVSDEFAAAAVEGRAFNMAADDIRDAMAGLAPAAQEFVSAFAEIFPQLQGIQDAVAGALFADLDSQLRALAQETIPDIGNALVQAGEVANRFFVGLSTAFQEIDFGQTFAAIAPALDSLGRAIANVVRTLQPFFEAAAPAARELASMIERASVSLLRMVEAGNQSGNLAAFFQQGLQSLSVWGDLIANVARALTTLFEAGTAGGNSMLQSLSNIIGRFNDWMNTIAGQSALEDFFEDGRRALSALTPVLQGAVGFFDNLVSPGAIDRFAELASAIGDVLPVLGQLFEIVGRVGVLNGFIELLDGIGEALQPAIPALQELASALGRLLSESIEALQPALDGIGEGLGRMAVAITPLVPLLADIAVALLEALGPEVTDLVAVTADLIEELAPLFAMILEAAMPLVKVMADLSAAWIKIQSTIAGGLIRAVEFLVSGFERLSEVAQDFLNILGKIPFLGAFLDWLGLTTDEADEAAGSVDHLAASAEELAPAIGDAADVIEDAAHAAENATTATDRLWGSAAQLRPAIEDAAAAIEGYTEKGLEQATAAAEKLRQEQDKLKVSLLETEGALREMSGAFEAMATREDALSRVFDLGNAPLDAATATRDILEGIKDAKEALKENKITAKDVIDVKTGEIKNTLKADPFLDAIDDLRPQIQAKLTESFTVDPTGEQARAQALTFIAQVTDALGGAFTPAQVAELLGLADFEDKITIAVELSQVAEAQAQLDALTGLGGETPLTATIQLALNKGTLSGDAAQAILNELAIAQGIPAEVLPEVTPEGIEEARRFIAANPGIMPTTLQFPPPEQIGDEARAAAGAAGPVIVPAQLKFGPVDIAASDVATFLDSISGPTQSLNTAIPIQVDATQADEAIAATRSSLTALHQQVTAPVVTVDPTVPNENIESLVASLGVLNTTTAEPVVSVPAYTDVFGQLSDLNSEANDFDAQTPSADVSVPAYKDVFDQLTTLTNKANSLDGKVIDITVNLIGEENLAHGGIAGPHGALAGEAGAEMAFFRNSARLLTQPTRVAPGTVVVPLEQSSRTTVGNQPVIARQVNNYMTFQVTSENPAAIATQVMNRAAAMASL